MSDTVIMTIIICATIIILAHIGSKSNKKK